MLKRIGECQRFFFSAINCNNRFICFRNSIFGNILFLVLLCRIHKLEYAIFLRVFTDFEYHGHFGRVPINFKRTIE